MNKCVFVVFGEKNANVCLISLVTLIFAFCFLAVIWLIWWDNQKKSESPPSLFAWFFLQSKIKFLRLKSWEPSKIKKQCNVVVEKIYSPNVQMKECNMKKTLFGIHLVNCHHHHYFYEWHLWHKHHWWLVIFKNSKFHNHYEWWWLTEWSINWFCICFETIKRFSVWSIFFLYQFDH